MIRARQLLNESNDVVSFYQAISTSQMRTDIYAADFFFLDAQRNSIYLNLLAVKINKE